MTGVLFEPSGRVGRERKRERERKGERKCVRERIFTLPVSSTNHGAALSTLLDRHHQLVNALINYYIAALLNNHQL